MSLARYLSKLASLVGSDGKVPAAGLASGAAVSNIGFTPVNKAGDTFTGAVQAPASRVGASSSAYPALSAVNVNAYDFTAESSLYPLGIRNDNTANHTSVGLAFGLGTDFSAFIAAEKNSASSTAAADLHFGSRPADAANFRKHMTIGANGAVLIPYQPSISAYMAADQTVSTSTWSKVNIDTAFWSQGGMTLDTTNKRIYVPVAGIYLISHTLQFASSSSEYLYSGISVNGTFIAYGEGRRATGTSFAWGNDNQLGNAQLVKLSANSYVELNGYTTGGGTLSGGTSRATLSIQLLS